MLGIVSTLTWASQNPGLWEASRKVVVVQVTLAAYSGLSQGKELQYLSAQAAICILLQVAWLYQIYQSSSTGRTEACPLRSLLRILRDIGHMSQLFSSPARIWELGVLFLITLCCVRGRDSRQRMFWIFLIALVSLVLCLPRMQYAFH